MKDFDIFKDYLFMKFWEILSLLMHCFFHNFKNNIAGATTVKFSNPKTWAKNSFYIEKNWKRYEGYWRGHYLKIFQPKTLTSNYYSFFSLKLQKKTKIEARTIAKISNPKP